MTNTRYYVARTNGQIQRCASLADANAHATNLYSLGVVAPLVVAAPDQEAALAKARRCYRGEIRIAQARKP